MTIEEFLAHLEGVQRHGDQWSARCPAHDDESPSLSVTLGQKGIILKCHAGCEFEAIVYAMQIQPEDLFYENGTNGVYPARREIVATYDYTDEAGQLLFQAVRYRPKDFRQRRPDGEGGWIWDLKQTRRVVYRLPRILAAVRESVTVFVVEGEKDVHALESWGLVATTNPMGAGKGKWLSTFADTLSGTRVVIVADNDAEGEEHAERIARSLVGIAQSVRVVRLPDLPKGGDVSDWIGAGGTKEEFARIAKAAPIWSEEELARAEEPPALPPPVTDERPMALPDPYPRTDLGNAHRLVERHGLNLRWSETWQTWMVWDGRRWARDPDLGADRYAHETVEAMYRAAWRIVDSDQQKEFSKFALLSQGGQRIQAMLRCARAIEDVASRPEQYDANDWVFNVENGTIDLATGKCRRHERADYITRLAPVRFDAEAECPLWLAFLALIFQEKAELIAFLQRACGYCLAGTARERCMFVLWGAGDNGKSTFLEFLRDLLGDYGHKMPKEVVTEMSRRGGQANPDVAALKGKRFCYFSETTTGGRLSEAFIKELTGNEAIWARDVYERGFNFLPQFKIFLGTNHKPRIVDAGKAFWNRVRLIPFTYSIPKGDQDPAFKDRLWEERSGILNWMLAGARDWLANGLQVPEIVNAATAEYRQEQDVLAQFLAECCVTDQTGMIKTRQKDVYDRYAGWCQETHETFVMKSREFRDRLADRGFPCEQSTGGYFYFKGIGLRVESNRADALQ